MANLYENIPEMQARAAANEQRRKIAESLLVQSQDQVQPFVNTGRMVAPMSITQGLAQMLKAYYAGKGIKSANEGDKALASEHAAKRQEVMDAYTKAIQGSPGSPGVAPRPIAGKEAAGPPVNSVPGTLPADASGQDRAALALAGSPYIDPRMAETAIAGRTWARQDVNTSEDRALRRDNALLAAETRLADITARMQDRQLTRDMQAQLAAEANATRLQIAHMTGALRQEPAPAYAEIIDPKDPSRMLKIDGRLYKGGSLGDPGVVGIAGKEPASAKAAETRGTGGKAVDEQVANLRDLYDQLDKGGGIVNPDKGAIANSAAWVKSSAAGQLGGRIVGTKNQSARSQVAQQRPLLLRAIMSATGMSARSLDSNAELKLWLSAATDPTLDVAANRAALDNIERQYGSAAVGKPDGGVAPAAPTGGALKFDAQGNQIP